jgi:pyruvate/2-oxoglutarate dehydrogenase complex dihydrolipoamide acyltransferase (E2) component
MPKKSLVAVLLVTPLVLAQPVAALSLNDLKAKLNEAAQPSAAPATTTPAEPAAAPPAATPATPSTAPSAASLVTQFSTQDQVGSLRQALTQSAETAVAGLAKENGFLGNDKVRIPLPESLQKVDSMLRKFGMGKYADDLTTSMNRAAEAAVPEAKILLVGAIKKMSVTDARDIITGPSDAATQYFRKNTEEALTGKFQPIIAKSIAKVKLAEKYDQFAGKGVELGLVDAKDANLKDYITRNTMDGLFLMMAEQEKIIRTNPMQAAGDLARKIFSAIKL